MAHVGIGLQHFQASSTHFDSVRTIEDVQDISLGSANFTSILHTHLGLTEFGNNRESYYIPVHVIRSK